jgi:hypothetical protein
MCVGIRFTTFVDLVYEQHVSSTDRQPESHLNGTQADREDRTGCAKNPPKEQEA